MLTAFGIQETEVRDGEIKGGTGEAVKQDIE